LYIICGETLALSLLQLNNLLLPALRLIRSRLRVVATFFRFDYLARGI